MAPVKVPILAGTAPDAAGPGVGAPPVLAGFDRIVDLRLLVTTDVLLGLQSFRNLTSTLTLEGVADFGGDLE